MPTFRVGYSYQEGGFVSVVAENEEHAEHIVNLELAQHGLDNIGEYDGYSTSNREYGVDEVEEVIQL